MKFRLMLATLIAGMAFCTSSSNGFDLLGRMLDQSEAGGTATSCCDSAASNCGNGCGSGCLNFDCGRRFCLGCPKFGGFFNHCGGGRHPKYRRDLATISVLRRDHGDDGSKRAGRDLTGRSRVRLVCQYFHPGHFPVVHLLKCRDRQFLCSFRRWAVGSPGPDHDAGR